MSRGTREGRREIEVLPVGMTSSRICHPEIHLFELITFEKCRIESLKIRVDIFRKGHMHV